MSRMLEGFGLTTAKILYAIPDHPLFLQMYVWQEFDTHPEYPKLHRFIDFWRRELEEAPLHSFQIFHRALLTPHEIRLKGSIFNIN